MTEDRCKLTLLSFKILKGNFRVAHCEDMVRHSPLKRVPLSVKSKTGQPTIFIQTNIFNIQEKKEYFNKQNYSSIVVVPEVTEGETVVVVPEGAEGETVVVVPEGAGGNQMSCQKAMTVNQLWSC